jgi:hypothetical protein
MLISIGLALICAGVALLRLPHRVGRAEEG